MKFRTAIIGCGRISFKHVEALSKNGDMMTLVATCDPVRDRAEKKAAEYMKLSPDSSVGIFSDFRKMLAQAAPEIVTIATESGKHAEVAVACLEAGCHVICEKPMALSTEDADRMILASKKSGKRLAVCFQNRFNGPVRMLRNAYEEGRFGKMLHGMIQVRWNRNESYYSEAPWRGTWDQDGGTLMNQCTHGIDLLQWMMGEDAVRVQAQTRRFMRPIEAEDFGCAIVEFRSGAVGIIEGTADVYPTNLNETLSLFGEHGTVVIGGLAVNKTETWRFSDAEIKGDPEASVVQQDAKDPPTVYGFGHAALFRDFAEAVRDGRAPLIDGERGKKALDIILAIYKSQKEGVAVDLPLSFSTVEMRGTFR